MLTTLRVSLLAGVMLALFTGLLLYGSPPGSAAATRPAVATLTSTPAPACGLFWRSVPPRSAWAVNYLYAASVVAENDIWAVGYTGQSSLGTRTLIEHWDGTRWEIVPSPLYGSLYDVEALSANDGWAVGLNGILHWDGLTWSVVNDPTTVSLYGLSAVSPTDIWAVGGYNGSVIVHWDSSQWTLVPHPNLGTAILYAVEAVSASDVWAVGSYFVSGVRNTLILHWNGTDWSIVPSPNPTTFSNELRAISAVSPTDIWAVGYSIFEWPMPDQPLIMHWDGKQWNTVPAPNLGSLNWHLNGVLARATNDVWVVGEYGTANDSMSLVMRWNGAQWNVMPSPDLLFTDPLYGMVSDSAGTLWAVGANGLTDGFYPVALRYSDPCWTPTSTPTGTPPTATRTPTVTQTYTPTNTNTRIRTITLTPTNSPTHTSTGTQSSTSTVTRTPSATATVTTTSTACPLAFTDVQATDYFYQAVRYLYCAGVISGYSDNTFRPYNNTTRAQICKIVVLAEGWPLYTPPTPSFVDVPPDHPYFAYIETAYDHGIISSGVGATFRPYNDVTRGQLCKIVVLAEEWPLYTPPSPTFSDVPTTNPFYAYIETAYLHAIISGYADLTFRPYNSATRGQICKIVYNAVTQP